MKTPFPPLPEVSYAGKPPLVTDADGSVSIEEAAAYFGCDIRRLRGWIHRNALHDPIGTLALNRVLAFSVERYLRTQEKRAQLSASQEQQP